MQLEFLGYLNDRVMPCNQPNKATLTLITIAGAAAGYFMMISAAGVHIPVIDRSRVNVYSLTLKKVTFV